MEIWRLTYRFGGSRGDLVAHMEIWRLTYRFAGSYNDLVAHKGSESERMYIGSQMDAVDPREICWLKERCVVWLTW